MKFDVTIGNPPYASENGKSSIYDKFILLGIWMSDIVTMITKDNWMNGKAFKNFRLEILNKGNIREIKHYPKIYEIFKDIRVPVVSFIWIKANSNNTKTKYISIRDGKTVLEQDLNIETDIIYKSKISKSILEKIGGKSKWIETFNTRSYPFMDRRKREKIESTTIPTEKHIVEVIINKEKPIYVSISNFSNVEEVKNYNIVCGNIINESSIETPCKVLTNIRLIECLQVPSESWSLIATLKTKEEAINCEKYIYTKFVRFITNQTVNNRSIVTDNTFECVPIQDFTNNSDIDWLNSIEEIDNQLYKKYRLTDKEIEQIEKEIK